jgi:2'-deoxynucleoside 5'-phosphate N-hydrolase
LSIIQGNQARGHVLSSETQAHIQVYVSGALTGVRDVDDQKRFYEAIADLCRRHRLTPYLPHEWTDPLATPHLSPKQVYERNRTEILRSQLMIAYAGLPSLGVGAEVELANQCKIPVILLFERGRSVSRHVRGIPLVSAEIQFERREEALGELEACLEDMIGQLPL